VCILHTTQEYKGLGALHRHNIEWRYRPVKFCKLFHTGSSHQSCWVQKGNTGSPLDRTLYTSHKIGIETLHAIKETDEARVDVLKPKDNRKITTSSFLKITGETQNTQ
jgi:hypothetical protein